VSLTQEWYGDGKVARLRKHLIAYAAGLAGATRFRSRVTQADTYEAVAELLDEYENWLVNHVEQ
ncbi:MAG: hypothetical protein FWD64_14405, partial [Acidobacteriaceae bacterium]|nr:hypothetical protein [Acidobacteriaceae bacterium]